MAENSSGFSLRPKSALGGPERVGRMHDKAKLSTLKIKTINLARQNRLLPESLRVNEICIAEAIPAQSRGIYLGATRLCELLGLD